MCCKIDMSDALALEIHHGDRARSCARRAVVSLPSPAVPARTAHPRFLTMPQVDSSNERHSEHISSLGSSAAGIPIDTDAATIRAESTAKAAVKLAVTPPTDTGGVRMFLPGGAGSQHPTGSS